MTAVSRSEAASLRRRIEVESSGADVEPSLGRSPLVQPEKAAGTTPTRIDVDGYLSRDDVGCVRWTTSSATSSDWQSSRAKAGTVRPWQTRTARPTNKLAGKLPEDVRQSLDVIAEATQQIEKIADESSTRRFATDYRVTDALLTAHEAWQIQVQRSPHPDVTAAYHALLMRLCDNCFGHLRRFFETLEAKPVGERVHSIRADRARRFHAIVHGSGESSSETLAELWNEFAVVDSQPGRRAKQQLTDLARMAARIEEGAWQDAGLCRSRLSLDDRVALLSFDRHDLDADGAISLLDAARLAQQDNDAAFAERILRELRSALPIPPVSTSTTVSAGPTDAIVEAKRQKLISAFDEKHADCGLTFQFVTQARLDIDALRRSGTERGFVQRIDFLLGDMKLDAFHVATELGYLKREIERSAAVVPMAPARVDQAIKDVTQLRISKNAGVINKALRLVEAQGLLALDSEAFGELAKSMSRLRKINKLERTSLATDVLKKANDVIAASLDAGRHKAAENIKRARHQPISIDIYRQQELELWSQQRVLEQAENLLGRGDRKAQQQRYMDRADLVVEQMARLLAQTPDGEKSEALQQLIKSLEVCVMYDVDDYVLPLRAEKLRQRFTEVTGVPVA